MKKIFVIIILILTLFFIGIPLFLIVDYYQHDIKRLTSIAISKNDPSICDNAHKTEFMGDTRENCYYQVATRNNNVLICEDYNLSDICFFTIAKQLNNPSICGKIKDLFSQNGCFYDFALYKRDVTVCNNIKNDDLTKNLCEKYSK